MLAAFVVPLPELVQVLYVVEVVVPLLVLVQAQMLVLYVAEVVAALLER